MKNLLILSTSLLLLLALAACNKKTNNTVREETGTEQPPQPPAVDPGPQAVQQVIGFQKTPCFGKCPVYQVKIYADGKASWYGKMYVDRIGWYDAKIGNEDIRRILDKAKEAGYFDLSDAYPTGPDKVVDLPSTVTYIRMDGQEKQIKNTHDAPPQLNEFQKFLEDLIMGLAWSPRAEKE